MSTLYRYRFLLGIGGAVVALLTKRYLIFPFLIVSGLGLCLRFWAVSYLGEDKGHLRPVRLITAGPYRYLRHPLYLGNFLIITGLAGYLALPIIPAVVILGGYLIFYYFFARIEERLLAIFPEYERYHRTVKPFLPITAYPRPEGELRVRNGLNDLPALIAVVIITIIGYW